jgi:hypothetical protein
LQLCKDLISLMMTKKEQVLSNGCGYKNVEFRRDV